MITQPEKGCSNSEGLWGFDLSKETAGGASSAPCLPAGGGGFVLNVACPSCELLTPLGERGCRLKQQRLGLDTVGSF